MSEMISIDEAAKQGIERLRKPIWANAFDHIKIDIVDGKAGLCTHLFSPFNKECNGRDPVDFMITNNDLSSQEWLPYTGFLPNTQRYLDEVIMYRYLLFSGRH